MLILVHNGASFPPPTAFPKTGIGDSFFTKSDTTVLSPPACGEIALENSAVHSASTHPSCPQAQRSTTAAMAAAMPATDALASKHRPSLFCFHFSFFTFFFIFLFSLGIGNDLMTCNTQDEVTCWLWKRWKYG